MRAARAHGIPVWSEIELGYRLLPDNPLLAVTGTKGKTTTSELLGHMLGAPVAGNVGRPLSALVGEVEPGELVVCEVSSFQLEDVDTFAPAVAVLLNLERDHLDRHGTVEAYRAAKLRIFENQGPDDVAVVPRGFGRIDGAARRVEFDADDELPAEPLIPGAHNRANAAAAMAAARAAGAAEDGDRHGPAHLSRRPAPARAVAEIGGVRYVNDSIATNTLAVRSALTTYDAPLHLILGGRPKGEPFDELAAAVAAADVVTAYLIGEASDELARALG